MKFLTSPSIGNILIGKTIRTITISVSSEIPFTTILLNIAVLKTISISIFTSLIFYIPFSAVPTRISERTIQYALFIA